MDGDEKIRDMNVQPRGPAGLGPARDAQGDETMLAVTIPSGVTRGECRINARPCDFEVHGNEFWFRYKGDQAWDKRGISQAIEDHIQDQKVIRYVCSNRMAEV
jgi:hypothetical protein